MQKFYTASVGNTQLHVVQCYRPDKGYTLLTSIFNQKFITWCLVCKDEDVEAVGHLDHDFVLKTLLYNVRSEGRLDDIMSAKNSVLFLGVSHG